MGALDFCCFKVVSSITCIVKCGPFLKLLRHGVVELEFKLLLLANNDRLVRILSLNNPFLEAIISFSNEFRFMFRSELISTLSLTVLVCLVICDETSSSSLIFWLLAWFNPLLASSPNFSTSWSLVMVSNSIYEFSFCIAFILFTRELSWLSRSFFRNCTFYLLSLLASRISSISGIWVSSLGPLAWYAVSWKRLGESV